MHLYLEGPVPGETVQAPAQKKSLKTIIEESGPGQTNYRFKNVLRKQPR